MDPEDITVEVRSLALGRLGQIDLDFVDNLKTIKRFNNVGSWQLSLPAEYRWAQELAKPGRGIMVHAGLYRKGVFLGNKLLISGGVQNFTKRETVEDVVGMYDFVGTDDMIHLSDGLAWPDPSNPDVATQALAYDVRTGTAETVLREYVNANRGPAAPAARRPADLRLQTNMNRGAVVTGRARFDKLGTVLSDVALAGGVGFDVQQVGDHLEFVVYEPQNKSDLIRMDIENDMLDETQYGFGAPTATRAIVAGQGEGIERQFIQITDAEAAQAELDWGRIVEFFKDRRDTDDPDELTQEGTSIVTENGRTIKSLSVKPSDEVTMVYAVDWYLGDIVGVVVDGEPLTAVVTEAIISIDENGVRVGATIGDPVGFDYDSRMAARADQQEARLAFIEKNFEVLSGVFPLDRIPMIPSEKITSLDAAKLTGYVDNARNMRKAILPAAFRGKGPTSVRFLDDSTTSASLEWIGEYVPWGPRVVNCVKVGEGWKILGQDYSAGSGRSIKMPLATGWTTYNDRQAEANWADGPFATQLPSGLVVLSGLITYTAGTPSGVIATLPDPDMWPEEQVLHYINNGDIARSITINPNGTLTVRSTYGANTYISLDGIAFWPAGVGIWTDVGSAGSGSSFGAAFEDWQTATGDANHGKASYWKDPYGFTWLKGLVRIKGAVGDGTNIINLPTGYGAATSQGQQHMRTTGNEVYAGIGAYTTQALGWKVNSPSTIGSWISLFGLCVMTDDGFNNNPWKNIEGYANSWGPYAGSGTSFPTPAYLRREDGLCLMKGMVAGGTLSVGRGFVVERELWPSRGRYLMEGLAGGVRGRLDIGGYEEAETSRSKGGVSLINGSNAYFSLDSQKWVPVA